MTLTAKDEYRNCQADVAVVNHNENYKQTTRTINATATTTNNRTTPKEALQKDLNDNDYSRFPYRLHCILTAADSELKQQQQKQNKVLLLSNIISWMPCGTVFKVHDPIAFERDVLPRMGRLSRFKSFLRQLNLYRFKRIRSIDGAAYAHPYFIRNHVNLCRGVLRGEEIVSTKAISSSTTKRKRRTVGKKQRQQQKDKQDDTNMKKKLKLNKEEGEEISPPSSFVISSTVGGSSSSSVDCCPSYFPFEANEKAKLFVSGSTNNKSINNNAEDCPTSSIFTTTTTAANTTFGGALFSSSSPCLHHDDNDNTFTFSNTNNNIKTCYSAGYGVSSSDDDNDDDEEINFYDTMKLIPTSAMMMFNNSDKKKDIYQQLQEEDDDLEFSQQDEEVTILPPSFLSQHQDVLLPGPFYSNYNDTELSLLLQLDSSSSSDKEKRASTSFASTSFGISNTILETAMSGRGCDDIEEKKTPAVSKRIRNRISDVSTIMEETAEGAASAMEITDGCKWLFAPCTTTELQKTDKRVPSSSALLSFSLSSCAAGFTEAEDARSTMMITSSTSQTIHDDKHIIDENDNDDDNNPNSFWGLFEDLVDDDNDNNDHDDCISISCSSSSDSGSSTATTFQQLEQEYQHHQEEESYYDENDLIMLLVNNRINQLKQQQNFQGLQHYEQRNHDDIQNEIISTFLVNKQ